MAHLEFTEKDSEQLLIEKEAKKVRDDLNHDPQLKHELFAIFRGEKKLDDASSVAQEYLRDLVKIAREKKMSEGVLRLALKNILTQEIDDEARDIVKDLNENIHYRRELLDGLKHEIIGPRKQPSEDYKLYMLGIRKICEEKSLDFRALKQKIYALLKKEGAEENLQGMKKPHEYVRGGLKRLGIVA